MLSQAKHKIAANRMFVYGFLVGYSVPSMALNLANHHTASTQDSVETTIKANAERYQLRRGWEIGRILSKVLLISVCAVIPVGFITSAAWLLYAVISVYILVLISKIMALRLMLTYTATLSISFRLEEQ